MTGLGGGGCWVGVLPQYDELELGRVDAFDDG